MEYTPVNIYYKLGTRLRKDWIQHKNGSLSSGDENKTRREVVRRKTARYLIKAEEIYSNHLAAQEAATKDSQRWHVSNQGLTKNENLNEIWIEKLDWTVEPKFWEGKW